MAFREVFSKSITSMKSSLDVHIVMPSNKKVKAMLLINQAFQEAQRLINIISAWQEGTELYMVNSKAGLEPVKVGDELYGLLKRSLYLSQITDGMFDVTFASIDKVWYFDKPLLEIPTQEKIKDSVVNINFENIVLDDTNQTVFIKNKKTKIELGAIGKGFIANKMKARLLDLKVEAGLINAGGDMICWGESIRDKGFWNIGVVDPNREKNHIAWLPIKNEAVATSGNYERFAMINNVRYSHIIHPKTGWPVSGIKSVTVISPDAELCDVVATSVFLMGVKDGLAFIDRFYDIKCFIVDENNKYHFSPNFNIQLNSIHN